MTLGADAPSLLRAVGLMADGPVVWGRRLPPTGPSVFLVELPAPLASAPIDVSRVGKWVERVETLRVDGERPTAKSLAARLASFWLPSQGVLYVGATGSSVGQRVAAMEATVLGDRRPQSAGHWLHTLRSLDGVRIWWAPTEATEEYEDALLAEFAANVPEAELASLPDRSVVLPWANLRAVTGDRKATGITGSLIAEPVAAPLPPTRVVVVPDGDAEGAHGEPPPPRRRAAGGPGTGGGLKKAPALVSPGASAGSMASGAPGNDAVDATELTPEGAERLQAELDQLVRVRRPEVIARIRTAKEHGDLKENSEYHAAREEQSFLEGRIQAIEARLRTAVIVTAPAAGSRVGLGSVVTVDDDGEEIRYTIVGAAEADVAHGRISSASPVGRALIGKDVGDVVTAATPAGAQVYRILAIE
jgi:transcription elongation factor GreA